MKKACEDSDIGVIEATLPKEWGVEAHLTGEEAGRLAMEANIKKLILTHVANTYLSDVKKDVKKYYKGKVIIAKDLMEFEI